VLILAFDASTPVITVAVARAKGEAREVLAEVSASVRGASETLLPSVNTALDLAGERLGSVDRVLAGVGPGTFTGIRIAATTARALALATGAALSKNSTPAAGPATRIYCERPEDLFVEGSPLIVGDGAVRYRAALSALGSIPPDDSPLHRVTATGHVLSADLAPVDAYDLVPSYVREPDAEVRRDLNPWSRP
jgi:tRNA threonylcarbamoyladenosine biosynthesis protein TsaB